jgi:multidrug resistance protein
VDVRVEQPTCRTFASYEMPRHRDDDRNECAQEADQDDHVSRIGRSSFGCSDPAELRFDATDRYGSAIGFVNPARQRSFPRGYGVIWTTVAIDLIGFGIVAPILPLYAERFGASGLTVGLLFASFSVAQFVCSPLLGRLSDRIGRKPVILLSLFGTAVGSFITGAAGSLFFVFVGRILDGASGASVSVAQGAVADVASPADRARLLGMLSAAFGVGFVIGPAIGSLAALGGPHVPFYVAGAIALVNGVVAIFRLPETRPAAADRVAVDVSRRRGRAPRGTHAAVLVRLAVVGFLVTCAFSGFEATFSLFADRRFGLTEASVAAVFVGIGVLLVLVQGGGVGRVTDRLGVTRTVQTAIVMNALGMVLLASATTWPVLVPALALLSIGQGLAVPSLTAMVVERAPVDRRGESLGFQQSASALARIGGPALGGALFDRAGVPWPYVVGAVLLGLAFTVLAGGGRLGVDAAPAELP